MLTLIYPAHHRLRNSEFIRLAKDVATVCAQNDPTALKIKVQLEQFTATIDELNRLFKIAQANVLTAELQAIDERRDRALIGIRLDAEGKLYHYNPETVKAAQLVLAAYDKYGKNLYRLNYYAETEVVESLGGDFTTEPELANALRHLHLTEWAAELATANQLFHQTFIARTGSNAARPDGNLLQQRAVSIEQYDVLARHIVAHHTLSPSPAYDKLVRELNGTIEGYNLLVAKRTATGEDVAELPNEGDPDAIPGIPAADAAVALQ
jgi:hypothetical protein